MSESDKFKEWCHTDIHGHSFCPSVAQIIDEACRIIEKQEDALKGGIIVACALNERISQLEQN